jgi:type IV pilus assembly protein PilV
MKQSTQCGFTLAEVLVSIFVLAIGIIGTAGMQLTALRTAQQTAFQTAAIQLASEIADSMRAHSALFRGADDANPFFDLDYSAKDHALPTMGGKCHVASCSAEEMAGFEIQQWKNRVRTVLPGGRIRICRDARPWDGRAGSFRWACTPVAPGMNAAALVIKIGWPGKGQNPDGSLTRSPSDAYPPAMAVTVAPYTK